MKRRLTSGEKAIAWSVYGDAIGLERVEIRNRKWWWFQPKATVMAPCGHIHCNPRGDTYSEDYSKDSLSKQGLFVHELCHVLQSQQRGRWYLPLMRHPFCTYQYRLIPGLPFDRYGLEQQAEIARHVFLLRKGVFIAGAPSLGELEAILPF